MPLWTMFNNSYGNQGSGGSHTPKAETRERLGIQPAVDFHKVSEFCQPSYVRALLALANSRRSEAVAFSSYLLGTKRRRDLVGKNGNVFIGPPSGSLKIP